MNKNNVEKHSDIIRKIIIFPIFLLGILSIIASGGGGGGGGGTSEPKNQQPVAHAGIDSNILAGQIVQLDGSESSDADSDPLSFTWSFSTRPVNSDAAFLDSTLANPLFQADVIGTYVAELIVNDGSANSLAAQVEVIATNLAPISNAGSDKTVQLGETIELDGSLSSDSNGDQLTFSWSLLSAPAGSASALSDTTLMNPQIQLDLAGEYVIQLVTNDGIEASNTDVVTLSTTNSAPIANAAINQRVSLGETLHLDGSASSDVDGDALSYTWSLTSVPVGSSAALTDPAAVNPTFTPDTAGRYVAQLIVNDGSNDSEPSAVIIDTDNSAPVAHAGMNQTLQVNAVAQLDGGRSIDVDGHSLTHRWSFVSIPAGSTAVISSVLSVNPQFNVDVIGDYVIQLIVNDGTTDSAADTVIVSTQNTAPFADAGADISAATNSAVQLNGSLSFDVDSDSLSYEWSLLSTPVGSSAQLLDSTTYNPSFTLDQSGTYIAQLIVHDGSSSSTPDVVIINSENSRPLANAGVEQSVTIGDVVQLNGGGSTDVDNDLLTYRWAVVSAPYGSSAAVTNPSQVTTSFTADVAGRYVAQLIVNDGSQDSAPSTVAINTDNSYPVANAGPDSRAYIGNTVLLDGSASTDPDENPLSYTWSLLSVPAGSTTLLADASTATPSFLIDQGGSYILQLMVNDGTLNSSPDTIIVTTDNTRPVADAGADQQVELGQTVQLDGSGSNDADGELLDYLWAMIAKPSGSATLLTGATTVTPTADPDLTGLYVAQLTVSDATTESDPDTTVVTVNPADADSDGLSDDQEAILGTDPDVADSDGDGLNDGDEVANGTDPLATDSDGDTLSDADELNIHLTNPLAADSDGDGSTDDEELDASSDPNDAQSTPPGPGAHLTRIETSPAHGEGDVAVTRETIVRFSRPLAVNSVIDETLFYAEFGGERLPARVHVADDRSSTTLFYNAPLPASARVRVTLNGDTLSDENGNALDADGNGVEGGTALIDFDTLTLTRVAGTRVCGRVFASELMPGDSGSSVNEPLEGVHISVDGLESTLFTNTDVNGNFCLEDAPAGRFFVHIDGRTATANIPQGAYYPFVGKAWQSIAGEEINIGNHHLPLVQPATLQAVSDTEETTISFPAVVLNDFPEFEGVSLIVPAGALYSDDGTTGGLVGIAPVPPDRVPGQLPPDLQFPLVITVQTDGATNFDEPIAACFPNLANPVTDVTLQPGEQTALWSFNHDTGRFEIAGSMTVNGDGSLVCTDPGSGVRAPGWHGVFAGVTVHSGQIFDYSDSGGLEVFNSSGSAITLRHQSCSGVVQAAPAPQNFNGAVIGAVRGKSCETQQEKPELNDCVKTGENSFTCSGSVLDTTITNAIEEGEEEPVPEEPQEEEAEEAADPVYLFSGEFYEKQTDLRIKGRGMDFVWARKYRSKIPFVTELGYQWDYSYNIKLAAQTNGNIVLFDGGTRQDEYLLQQDGSWAKPEFFRKITQNQDNTYTLNFASNAAWGFSPLDGSPAQGKITYIEDRNGNRLSFAYNVQGQLSVITDTLDREIIVAYNGLGLIESVTDFIGRTVSYAYYDGTTSEGSAGDLRSVTSPTVSDTPNGNNFPSGKTTRYTYTTGFADDRLNHNITTITDGRRNDSNDPSFGNTPYLINSYAESSNSGDLTFDRVASQLFGGDRIDLVYEALTPSTVNGEAVIKTTVNDRLGNVKEFYWDEFNRGVLMRKYTGRADPDLPTTSLSNRPTNRLRTGDPEYFETKTEHNADSLPVKITYPNGNITEYVYESDLNATADARSRSNLRIKRHLPGSHTPAGDQSFIQASFEYDSVYNSVTTHTDGRGSVTTHTYDANGNRTETSHRINSIIENYEYNQFGQLTAHILPKNGSNQRRRDEYLYYAAGDQKGFLENTIIDAGNLNLTTAYEYDLVGNMVRKTDPRGNDIQYVVNELNQVVRRISREVGNGLTTRYQRDTYYDANNNVIRRDIQNIDETGALQTNSHFTTTYKYEILDRLTQTTQEVSEGELITTEYEYDANRNQTVARSGEAVNGNQPSNVVQMLYDERDLLYKTIQAPGDDKQSSNQFDYDLNGNLVSTTIGLEHATPLVTQHLYDGYNRKLSTADPMGNLKSHTYDANHNLVTTRTDGELVDIAGSSNNIRLSQATFAHDAMNRTTWSGIAFFDTASQANIGDGLVITQTYYSDTSQVIQMFDDNNHQTSITYDSANRRSVVTDHKNNTVTYGYDANSNVVSITSNEKSDLGNPDQNFVTTNSYDNLDRLTKRVDNVGNTNEYAYDSRHNNVLTIDAQRPTVDDPGNVIRHAFDGINRSISTSLTLTDNGNGTGAVTDTITTGQEWDDNHRLVAQIDDNGNRTTYGYDLLNRKNQLTYADNTQVTYQYDSLHNLIASNDANGNQVANQYDLLNRITRRDITPGTDISSDTTFENYQYDGLSRYTRGEDNDSIVSRAYNSLSQMTKESLNGQTTTTLYDGVGNQLALSYPGGRSITTTYDELNRKQTIADQSGVISSYSYIGPQRNERRSYANQTQSDWLYDGVRRTTGTKHTFDPAGAANIIDNRSYTWDPMHNKTSRQNLLAGGVGVTHTYSYDSLYRMSKSQISSGETIDYMLDGVGNRTNVSGGDSPGNYTLDNTTPAPADFQTNQYSTTSFDSRHYDLNGNLKTINTGQADQRALSYDYRNQMVTYSTQGVTSRYQYDVFGRRIAKTASDVSPTTTHFFYDGWRVVEEQGNNNTTQATYVYGRYIDEVLSMQRSGQNYFYHADDMHNVMKVTDSVGAVVEQYEYGDYGEPQLFNSSGVVIAQSVIGNPYLFNGRRYDDESGLYYYRTRYLDSGAGRFTTRDVIGIWGDSLNGGNGYSYVASSPWTKLDPLGYLGFSDLAKGINTVLDLTDFAEQALKNYAAAVGGQVAGEIIKVTSGDSGAGRATRVASSTVMGCLGGLLAGPGGCGAGAVLGAATEIFKQLNTASAESVDRLLKQSRKENKLGYNPQEPLESEEEDKPVYGPPAPPENGTRGGKCSAKEDNSVPTPKRKPDRSPVPERKPER